MLSSSRLFIGVSLLVKIVLIENIDSMVLTIHTRIFRLGKTNCLKSLCITCQKITCVHEEQASEERSDSKVVYSLFLKTFYLV